VRRARRLLDAGTTPAEAAAAVGFSDQPHLNRHFARIVGVPPGAYQRERKNVQDPQRRLLVPSKAWQNRQLSQTGRAEAGRTPPSSGTPWGSVSP
jgi:AraC-like DNA-binding protein